MIKDLAEHWIRRRCCKTNAIGPGLFLAVKVPLAIPASFRISQFLPLKLVISLAFASLSRFSASAAAPLS